MYIHVDIHIDIYDNIIYVVDQIDYLCLQTDLNRNKIETNTYKNSKTDIYNYFFTFVR